MKRHVLSITSSCSIGRFYLPNQSRYRRVAGGLCVQKGVLGRRSRCSTAQRTGPQSAEFFSQPSEAKVSCTELLVRSQTYAPQDKLAWDDPRANRGYVKIGRERVTQSADASEIAALREKAPDYKEVGPLAPRRAPEKQALTRLCRRWRLAATGTRHGETSGPRRQTCPGSSRRCSTSSMRVGADSPYSSCAYAPADLPPPTRERHACGRVGSGP
jgi:hypothetical protein